MHGRKFIRQRNRDTCTVSVGVTYLGEHWDRSKNFLRLESIPSTPAILRSPCRNPLEIQDVDVSGVVITGRTD